MKACLVLFALLVLTLVTRDVVSYVTVRVQLNPSSTTTVNVQDCSATFLDNLQGNLTAFVLSATHDIPSLEDFVIPSGLHLTYVDNSTSATSRRAKQRQQQQQRDFYLRSLLTTTKKPDPCSKCTSAGCSLSCGIGACGVRCGTSRRRELATTTTTTELTTTASDRSLAMTWDDVGLTVTEDVAPSLYAYVSQNQEASACLGDALQLEVNVTFLSDLPFDATLENALVEAFGVNSSSSTSVGPTAAPISTNNNNACCTQSFKSCVNYCGSTEQSCNSCSDKSVVWLSEGLASNANTCTGRWSSCTNNVNSCCAGLSCVGDKYWKGCLYVAPSSSPTTTSGITPRSFTPPVTSPEPTIRPTPPPTTRPTPPPTVRPTPPPTSRPTGCCTQSFKTCVNYCGSSQQQCESCGDRTVAWLPQGLPSNANTCIARWAACTNNVNGCCAGLTCNGNQWYRQCQYVA